MRPSDKFRQKYDGSGSKGNKQVSELLEKMRQNSSNNSRYQGSENEDDVSMVDVLIERYTGRLVSVKL